MSLVLDNTDSYAIDIELYFRVIYANFLTAHSTLCERDTDLTDLLNILMWRQGFFSSQPMSLREIAANINKSHEYVRLFIKQVDSMFPEYLKAANVNLTFIEDLVSELAQLCPTSLAHASLHLAMRTKSCHGRFDISVLLSLCDQLAINHELRVVNGCLILNRSTQENLIHSIVKQTNMCVSRFGACFTPDLVRNISSKLSFDVYDIEAIIAGMMVGDSTPIYPLDKFHITSTEAHSPVILIAKKCQAVFGNLTPAVLFKAWSTYQSRQDSPMLLSNEGLLMALRLDKQFDVSGEGESAKITYIGDPLIVDNVLKQYEYAAFCYLKEHGIATKKQLINYAQSRGLNQQSMASMLLSMPFLTQFAKGRLFCLLGEEHNLQDKWLETTESKDGLKGFKINANGSLDLLVGSEAIIQSSVATRAILIPSAVAAFCRSLPGRFTHRNGRQLLVSDRGNEKIISGIGEAIQQISGDKAGLGDHIINIAPKGDFKITPALD